MRSAASLLLLLVLATGGVWGEGVSGGPGPLGASACACDHGAASLEASACTGCCAGSAAGIPDASAHPCGSEDQTTICNCAVPTTPVRTPLVPPTDGTGTSSRDQRELASERAPQVGSTAHALVGDDPASWALLTALAREVAVAPVAPEPADHGVWRL